MRMEGKTAVVTGSATGIGRAIAERLAAEGAVTFCGDVEAEGVEATARAIRENGGRAEGMRCDVSDPDDVEARCILAFSLLIGDHYIAADHGARSRADVLELALRRLAA